MVWGGRDLGRLLHKDLPTAENYGESWDVSDHALHQSVVASAPLSGMSLHQLLEAHGREIMGSDAWPRFPWLIKFLDASDWLSVQVHPDDAKVGELWPGESGKTEAWFVIDARPDSRIYAGLLPGVGPQEFSQGLARGEVTQLLHSFVPRPGDCVFLPAGTVHAVGGGVLQAEIQQTSDATFRLFDWNRRDAQGRCRQLHIEQGLAAIDWSQGPVAPIAVADFNQASTEACEQSLVRCPYFHLSYLRHGRPFTLANRGTIQVLVVLRGQAEAHGYTLGTGEVWLVPACLSALTVVPRPELTALLCTLPGRDQTS